MFGTAAPQVLVASTLAPFAVSWLWGKQVLAGFTTAAAAPWLLPVAILAAVAWCIYRCLEAVGSLIGGRVMWVIDHMPTWRIA